jgi:hypothetical protein
MDDTAPLDGNWHLDKRIPIALIGAILTQAAGFGYWAASISARVDSTERRVHILETHEDESRKSDQVIQRELGKITANLETLLQRSKP